MSQKQNAENIRTIDYHKSNNIILNRQISAEQLDEPFIPIPYDSIRLAITKKKFIEMGGSIENLT